MWRPSVGSSLFPPRNFLPSENPNSVLGITLGTFDGCHLGHKVLVETLHEELLKRSSDIRPIVLSLYPHPRSVLSKRNDTKIDDPHEALLTPLRSRIDRLSLFGAKELGVIRFNKSLSEVSGELFIRDIICKHLKPEVIVVGYDWSFGKNRSGSIDELVRMSDEYGFTLVVVPEQKLGDQKIGARRIRESLENGALEELDTLLGVPFSVTGRVIEGDKRGREIGFPTANLLLQRQLLPKYGVYESQVYFDDRQLKAITNIGRRPTFSGTAPKLETHILDFTGDLYDKVIRVELLKFIRPEKKFSGVSELKKQIALDISSIT